MDTYVAGSTIYQSFNTHKADGTPITLAGSASLAVYKDDGTTEDTGDITLAVDFDSVTGLHNFKIDTSQDGTFYATGHTFSVVIDAGTVDSVSQVGMLIYTFRLGNVPAEVKAMANDVITAAAHDESTAFPLKSADTGSTAVARTGADSDTLETLSDQLDAEATKTAAIKAKTDMQPAVWYTA